MKKKLIVFDMDGTILNTLDDITDAVNYIMKKYDMPVWTADEVKYFVGNGLRRTLERSVPKGTDAGTFEKLFVEFVEYYKANSKNKTRPYDGIAECLRILREKGYLLAVVSNKREEAVRALAAEFFDGCFNVAFGDKEGIKIKPAPDMVEAVLNELKIEKKEAVYVGDSDVDLLTAKNSSVDCIAVSWGFRGRTFLEEHGAECIIDKPGDIMSVLEQ